MNNIEKSSFREKIADFRLPRYNELPDVGLYLEQVIKYINGKLSPLGWQEITPSMVSNYVKKNVIPAPEKKQYFADQLGYLIFISITKTVLSIENISLLIKVQKDSYTAEVAYNYFCDEFENMLRSICGLDTQNTIHTTNNDEKSLLRSVIIAVSHIAYANSCFETKKESIK